MKKTTLSHHIKAFKTEALMLLRFQFAYNRILKFDEIHNISRSDFVDRCISLKAIENDLVIRICKFDDDTNGVHSFKKAINEIPEIHPNKKIIENKIKTFGNLIEKVKKERRHTQLAHLKIGATDGDYKIRYDLIPAIKQIVDIIDLMHQATILYKWNDGRYEKFDLRYEVLNESQKLE